MNQTILNLAAMCDKAGRPTNQDNFFVCQDLSANVFSSVKNDDKDVLLSDKGALVVVADGMGGMNAGEVASKIVIETIKSSFSNIPDDFLKDERKIKGFITQTIISADREVKQYANEHPEASGMGSTVVILWLLNGKAYVGWCGDSRAYCYNPQNRLVRLTHDHSYVQDLVDQKKISENDAFYHPDSNIITRSIGDSGQRANPDVEAYPIHKDDVFLLCSDGLCGLLRDDEIQSIIGENSKSMKGCLMELWNQGTRTGWSDNATIELVRVKECIVAATNSACGWAENHQTIETKSQQQSNKSVEYSKLKKNLWIYIPIVALIVGLILGFILGRKTIRTSINNDNSSSDQISFLQQEIMRLNHQNDSLQNVIVNIGRSSQQRQNIEQGKQKQQEPSKKDKQVQKDTHKEQQTTITPNITPNITTSSPEQQEDFSKLDPNFIQQIQRTINDFESFKNRIESCAQVGYAPSQELHEMNQRLNDIKSNVRTIKNNDSYQYIPPELKQSVNNIDVALPGLQRKLTAIKPAPQQVPTRINGNSNMDEL